MRRWVGKCLLSREGDQPPKGGLYIVEVRSRGWPNQMHRYSFRMHKIPWSSRPSYGSWYHRPGVEKTVPVLETAHQDSNAQFCCLSLT